MKKGLRKVWVMGAVFFTVTAVYFFKIAPNGWTDYLNAVQWMSLGAFGALTAEHFKKDSPKPGAPSDNG